MRFIRFGLFAAVFLFAGCSGDLTAPENGAVQKWRITALSSWSLQTMDPPSRTACEAITSRGVTLTFRRTGNLLAGTVSPIPAACYSERWDRGVIYSRIDTIPYEGGPITGRFSGDSLFIEGPPVEFGVSWQIAGLVSESASQSQVLTGVFCRIFDAPCPQPTQLWGGVIAMLRTD